MENFLIQLEISFNSTAPFFLIMFLGWFLVKRGIVGDKFIKGTNKLVFNVLFPISLFMSIFQADLEYAFDPALVGYYVVLGVFFYILCWFVCAKFLQKWQVGPFVQAVNRSNYIVIAMAILAWLIGEDALPKVALMVPFVVTVNNVLTAVVFLVSGMKEGRSSASKIKHVLLGVVKTPMVIAVALGVVANFAASATGFSMPLFVSRAAVSLSDMASPAVLLAVGGVLSIDRVRRNLRIAMMATFLKNIIHPLAFIVPAVLLGFRGTELAIISMIGLAPTGAMTYAVAVEMGENNEAAGDLAAGCLVLSNSLSLFTIVPALTILRVLELF